MNKKLAVTLIAILAAAAVAFGALFGVGLGKQADLEKAKAELETAKDTAEASARELQGSLDSAAAEIEMLKGDLEAANGKTSQLEKDLEGANAQAESLNEELATTRERAEELARGLETARSESAEAQEMAEAANAEKTALSAELERYKVKQTELETELETNSSALSQANSELESVKADLEAKNAELETARNSGTVAPVTVPDSEGAYDATRFFTSTLKENGIKFSYEGLNDDRSDIVSSMWTLQDVDVKFLIVFNENGRVYMRAFNIIDYEYENRAAVLEAVNALNSEYLFVNWCVDDSDNSVTATYDLPALEAKDAGKIGYSAMDSMVDVVNEGMSRLKPYMK